MSLIYIYNNKLGEIAVAWRERERILIELKPLLPVKLYVERGRQSFRCASLVVATELIRELRGPRAVGNDCVVIQGEGGGACVCVSRARANFASCGHPPHQIDRASLPIQRFILPFRSIERINRRKLMGRACESRARGEICAPHTLRLSFLATCLVAYYFITARLCVDIIAFSETRYTRTMRLMHMRIGAFSSFFLLKMFFFLFFVAMYRGFIPFIPQLHYYSISLEEIIIIIFFFFVFIFPDYYRISRAIGK